MANLDGTLPALQSAYASLQAYGAGLGIAFDVADYGGFRTQADTAHILAYRAEDYAAAINAGSITSAVSLDEFRPIAAYGSSYHDYGAAFDANITSKSSSMSDEQALAILGGAAPAYGLKWGGTFTNPDTAHFELDEPLTQAAQDYSNYLASGGSLPDTPGGLTSLPVLAALAGVGIILFAIARRFVR
jgi:D-alanyl-D-alanine carboxypeptidase